MDLLQNRSILTDSEKKLTVTNVEMEGVSQELGMNAHTRLCVSQRTSKDLLCGTGNSTQYSVIM